MRDWGRRHAFRSFFPEASEISHRVVSEFTSLRHKSLGWKEIRVAPPISARFCQDHRYRWYRDCGIGLYSPDVRNCGEQASVRKVAIPNVLKALFMFLLQSVSIRNSSPNPELELPRNNLLKRLFGWNIA